MTLLDRILHRGPPDVSEMRAARDVKGHAVHCALGLIQMKEPRAAEFLREALASGKLAWFSNWVWGEKDEAMVRRALALFDTAAGAPRELR